MSEAAHAPCAASPVSDAVARAFAELEGRPRGKVLMAMSGGVDSSVAACLLQEAGFECVGATMRLYDTVAPGSKTCCSMEDILDARAVCARLGMRHETLDLRDVFERCVIADFVRGYEAGLTPNPCVTCNRALKFGELVRLAAELGCAYLATGHYARVRVRGGRAQLLRGPDPAKDQSYVLYPATAEQLGHLLLPLGALRKEEVRAIAEDCGLPIASKGDSQDICFVPQGDYAGFLEARRGSAYPSGEIVAADGSVLGEHAGLPRYTIGQRKGLGVALGRPVYVLEKDVASNRLVVGEAAALRRGEFAVGGVTWQAEVAGELACEACVRYHGRPRPVRVTREPDVLGAGQGNERVRVRATAEPFPSLAPGQSCVFYDGDLLLGGGVIV